VNGPGPGAGPVACSYVLPLRRWGCPAEPELARYLEQLVTFAEEVIVVDGSEPWIFERHRRSFPPGVRHLPVDPTRRGVTGKVNGVLTGMDAAGNEALVIADDDVRYTPDTLAAVCRGLERGHLVRPQNVFEPLVWHARWDTARSLLNRAVAADYPGTLAVRRSVLLATDGYDADVLFENLELIRTVRAAGGVVVEAPDVYVPRRPCSTRHFLRQRVRQAYDSSATPLRQSAELALLPLAVLGARRRPTAVAGGLAASVLLAERGRRRAGGRQVYPRTSALFAPLWVVERAVCSWLAVLSRLRHGGVRYGGATVRRAATPERVLRRRLAGTCSAPVDGSPRRVGRDGVEELPAAQGASR
jgi:hypothetical protein